MNPTTLVVSCGTALIVYVLIVVARILWAKRNFLRKMKQYDFYRHCFNNRRAVYSEGKWGFVDARGDKVIEPQFDETKGFRFGLAEVSVNGKIGMINPEGEYKVPLGEYQSIELELRKVTHFMGFPYYLVVRNGLYGLLDQQGEVSLEPEFEEVGLSDWYGPSPILAVRKAGRWGIFDFSRNRLVIQPIFDEVGFEKTYPVRVRQGERWGCVGANQTVLPMEYKSILNFEEPGLAAVQHADSGLWGYINLALEVVIPCKFQEVKSFEFGSTAHVKIGHSWGTINRHGQPV